MKDEEAKEKEKNEIKYPLRRIKEKRANLIH